MFFKTMRQSSGTRAGLSVAFLALMSGMALAQDQGLGDNGGISILPADDFVLTDPPVGDEIVPDDPGVVDEIVLDDEIIYEGEPDACIDCELPPDAEPTDPGWIDDGVSPMPEIPDPVRDGEGVNGDEPGEVTIYDSGDDSGDDSGGVPESTCGGCEYQTMAGPTSGGPVVQRRLIDPDSGADGLGETVRNDTNICFDADLYVPLLCDWQRPFLGDLMP